MRFVALAADYDGTIATHGVVDDRTLAALERFASSGRHLLLVTGRRAEEVASIFECIRLFTRVVAENGAVLFTPSSGALRRLGPAPPRPLVDALREHGVEPLAIGHVVVATSESHRLAVAEWIRSMHLALDLATNKGALMVLPRGVDKRAGLAAALEELGVSRETVVAVGDAENDEPFVSWCGLGVAVANAVPSLRDVSDWVTPSPAGAGVVELVERVLDLDADTDPGTGTGWLKGTRA